MPEATFFRQGGNEPDKISQWVIHKPVKASMVMFSAWAIPGAFGNTLPTWLAAVGALIGWVVTYFILRAQRRHQYGLCTTCLNQPLGTDKDAERHKGSLQFFHWVATHALPYVSAVLVTSAVVMGIGLFLIDNPVVKQAAFLLPIYLWMGLSNRNMRLHEWLRPQCPFCRRGGGGGLFERVPDPDPAASNTR